LLALISLVSGCAVSGSGEKADPVAQKLDEYVVEAGVISHEVTDENVARLWQESEIFRRNGDLDSARGRLQQAIVITPKDAVLWSRAAEIELSRREHLRAENYAAKSNFLATVGNPGAKESRQCAQIARVTMGKKDDLDSADAGTDNAADGALARSQSSVDFIIGATSAELLSDDGPFVQSKPGFSARQEQLQLAAEIDRCIEEDNILVGEAGTGVGKTFAYLVPAITCGKRVIISTGTREPHC